MRCADAPSAPPSASLTVLHLSRTHRRYHSGLGVNPPGNSRLLPEDDLSDSREGPPGRCLDGPPRRRSTIRSCLTCQLGTHGACVTCWADASRRCPSGSSRKDRDPRFVTLRRGGTLTIRITSSSPSRRHRARSTSLTCSSRLGLKNPRSRHAMEQARAWMRGEITMSRGPAAPRRSPEFECRGAGCHDWVLRGEVAQDLLVIGLDNREAVRVVVSEDRPEHDDVATFEVRAPRRHAGVGHSRGLVRRSVMRMLRAGRVATIVVAAALGLALPGAASAATIAVTTTADSVANGGGCSLREAVTSANADDGGSSGCTAATAASTPGHDRARPRTYTLSGDDGDDANVVRRSRRHVRHLFAGAGPDATVIDAQARRPRDRHPGRRRARRSIDVTLQRLRIRNGSVLGAADDGGARPHA